MKKLSVDSLNNLFSFLEQQSDSVLWIRSKSYKRQLYLSANFEQVWGYPSEIFYQNPDNFEETLHPEDRVIARQMVQSDETGEQKTSYLYRIQTPSGEIKHIKDWHYLLTDKNELIIGYAGFAKVIDEQQWHSEQEKNHQINSADPEQILQRTIFGILKNEMHIEAHNIAFSTHGLKDKKGKHVELTAREQECLTYLIAGKSAKQTGAILNISQRTVEFHLDNVKVKVGCRTKLELLGKVKGG